MSSRIWLKRPGDACCLSYSTPIVMRGVGLDAASSVRLVAFSTTFQPFANPSGIARHDARGYAHHSAVVGDVGHHHRVGADDHVVSDGDAAQYLCSRREHDVVADLRWIG